MHASGIRSLKYIFDYISTPDYETQYYKIHKRNIPFYEEIERAFANTKACGVRVYRPPHRIKDALLPQEFAGEAEIMRTYFSDAVALLSCHAIPVSYEGDSDYAAVFGDDALYFEDKHKRVVLDISAALILKEKGFDVGIEAVTETTSPCFEHFGEEKFYLHFVDAKSKFVSPILKEGACVKSRYNNGCVASFEYKNFLVLNFDAFSVNEASTLYCSYERGKQLQEFFGNPYPSICGYANLYSICAERDNKHIVLFQNHSVDPVFDFDIKLPKPCKNIRLLGAEGEIKGQKIHITTEFSPQSTFLLEVEYE